MPDIHLYIRIPSYPSLYECKLLYSRGYYMGVCVWGIYRKVDGTRRKTDMLPLLHLPCYNRAMSPDDHPDATTRRTRSLTAYPELGLLAPVWERVRAACVRMGHTRGRAFKLESVRGGVRVTRTR